VGERERRARGVQRGERSVRIELTGPRIVEADNLETSDLNDLVAKDLHTGRLELSCQTGGNFRMGPNE
jgi:hypothetical protein